MKFSILTFAFFISLCSAFGQENDDLLNELESTASKEELLPSKMMLTQRAFWGENGLYRKIGLVPELTAENRQKELKIRRNMLRIHQAMGYITAAGFLGQGLIGTRMYGFDFQKKDFSDYEKLLKTHRAIATGTNIAYGTTALMAFTAPPAQIRRRGVNSITVHKALSYVHLSGMIATNVLAQKQKTNGNLKPYHRAAAFTTFASFLSAIVIIKFEI